MAAYLWIYWRYIGGAIGSPDTAAWRREHLRARRLPAEVWTMAVFAGLVGFGALLTFAALLGRLLAIPPSQPIVAPAGMPPITTFVLLVMGSLVAGVTEEAGFRGYMQMPIERRFGVALESSCPEWSLDCCIFRIIRATWSRCSRTMWRCPPSTAA